MKRYGNLWPQIVDYGNLLRAHDNAKRGKAHYREVKMVNSNEDLYLGMLQRMLINREFTTSEYTVFDKFDGRKDRTLYKLPYYPDRIVQHALIQVCGPIWESSMIRDTFQSLKGRGTSDARKRVKKAIRGNPGLYALKFDIRKFYPSVDNEILKSTVRKKIKCEDTLWLIDNIIDSESGIPIGNYTSQFWGNLYLTPFDWWVVQTLKPRNYFRYCDDIIVVGYSSNELHETRKECFRKLNLDFNLRIKGNWQVFPIDKRGLDFCGYIFKPNSVRVRPSIASKFRAKTREIRKSNYSMMPTKISNSIGSYWGWCKYSNAKVLFRSHLHPIRDTIRESKERISAIQRARL